MKTRFLHILLPSIIFIALLPILASCQPEPDDEEPHPVLEAWIDSEGYPRAIFSLSYVNNDDESIIDKIIRWGYVTISDGDRTIVMTGGRNNAYFPPYTYFSHEMNGEPGRTYTVDASYHDYHIRATCRMPDPPEVIGIKSEPVANNDTLRNVTVSIRAPHEVPAYYHISARVLPDEETFIPSVLGCAMATTPDEVIDVPVYRGKRIKFRHDYTSRLPRTREVLVRVERVTKEVYDFWMDFNDATLFGSSIFVTNTSPLRSNVDGGYGYFSAQGVKILKLEQEMPSPSGHPLPVVPL